MPSLKMKNNLNMGCLREKGCLQVCKKSTIISKNSYPCVNVAPGTAEFDSLSQYCRNACTDNEVSSHIIGFDEAIMIRELTDMEDIQAHADHTISERMVNEFTPAVCASNVDTIFSPILEALEVQSGVTVHGDAGNNNDPGMLQSRSDDTDDYCRSGIDNQTCNISDFYISDMIVTGLPFSGDTEAAASNAFTDYRFAESSLFFNMAECYKFMPFFENTIETSNIQDLKSSEESMMGLGRSSLCLAIDHLRSDTQDSDLVPNLGLDQDERFDPYTIIKDLPDLSDTVSTCQPTVQEKDMSKRKTVTLVLDLDETLVHSTLENCDDADFSFPAFFNLKEHIVYVKERPFLRKFLERVAEMFEIVIFTASQSIYAKQLLDILDPDGNIISRRFYRESCNFSDGSYTKDLTILGVDLAKVAIIDNSPQVYQLQIDNGIPITSWFDDASDGALISLLPFLETLVDADDVRPIISKRFGNKE